MKKCLLLVAAVFLAATWTAAEAIDAVSFNPARLGRYENLKISGGLTSKGGISAQAVTVQSGGTVTFNNAGNYQADRTEVQGTLNMPNTDFNTTTLYSSGPASFVGSGTSQIGNMIGASMRVQANRMALRQVSVSGEATTDYNGNSISGFVLGNNTIPTAPSECQGLQWVTRLTDDNQSYKVLGFASCGTEESTEQDCTENPNQQKCCTGENVSWNGSQCVRSCSAYGEMEQSYIQAYNCHLYDAENEYSYPDYQGGTCSVSNIVAESGAAACDHDGYSIPNYSDRNEAASAAAVTCADMADNMFDRDTFEGEFRCSFAVPVQTNYSGYYDSLAGVLICRREKYEWTCPSTQSCGTTQNSCR